MKKNHKSWYNKKKRLSQLIKWQSYLIFISPQTKTKSQISHFSTGFSKISEKIHTWLTLTRIDESQTACFGLGKVVYAYRSREGRQQRERYEIKALCWCAKNMQWKINHKCSEFMTVNENNEVLASHGTHCNAVYVWFQYLSLLFSLSERDWKTVLTREEPRLADSSIRLSMNSFTWVSNCLIRSAFKCWKKQ